MPSDITAQQRAEALRIMILADEPSAKKDAPGDDGLEWARSELSMAPALDALIAAGWGPGVERAVKPLAWEWRYECWTSTGADGCVYWAGEMPGGRWECDRRGALPEEMIGWRDSFDGIKALAQADYEARVLAALEPVESDDITAAQARGYASGLEAAIGRCRDVRDGLFPDGDHMCSEDACIDAIRALAPSTPQEGKP